MGCSEAGISTVYTGETSRNMFLRGLEHSQALAQKKEESVLWQHTKLAHGGEDQTFHMNILRKHQTAFERQVSEGIAIEMCKADLILNLKSEWNRAALPKMAIEVTNTIKLREDEMAAAAAQARTFKDKERGPRDNLGQNKRGRFTPNANQSMDPCTSQLGGLGVQGMGPPSLQP